jgi:transglutaminase-like putative cysteine protease
MDHRQGTLTPSNSRQEWTAYRAAQGLPMASQVPKHSADSTPPTLADRYFEVSLLLMLATSFTMLALAGQLDIPSKLVFSAALVLKLWKRAVGSRFNLRPSAATGLGILCIFFYAADIFLLSRGSALDRILAATVHLVLFAAVIKVFSTRTYRDYGYLAALSFLMVLAAAVYTVSVAYLVGLALYILFSISAFAGYEIKRSSEAAGEPGRGAWPCVPTPSESRYALEKSLLTTSVAVTLGVILLGSLLFFVLPRYRTGYLTALASPAEHITGFSETVSLGDIGKIKRSNAVVMRVEIGGSPGLFKGVKWRGVGLTSFDGKRWFNDNTNQYTVFAASPDRFLLPSAEGWQRRRHLTLRYRVLLAPLSTDVLFVAAVPRQLTGRFRLLSLDQTQSVHNPLRDNAPLAYDVVTEAGGAPAEELRHASTDTPAEIRLTYLRTPGLNPAVAELARQVTASATNNYDRALAIQNYLGQNFGYTLDPVGIDPADPVGSFLLKSRQGYCEYFAAAMALMLRSVNIPSRLVNGFQTGSYNRVGEDLVVRARDAHTWVEVYFAGYGWIPFDPTPPDPGEAAETWSRMDDYLDALSVFWSEWIINYDFGHQVRVAMEFDRQSSKLQQSLRDRFRDLQHQGSGMTAGIASWLVDHKLLGLCLTFGLLCGLALGLTEGSLARLRLFWLWRCRRHGTVRPDEATLVYEGLLRILRKKGVERAASQTPREFARQIAVTPLAGELREFTELYTLVRFGQQPVSASRLRQLLEAIRRAAL